MIDGVISNSVLFNKTTNNLKSNRCPLHGADIDYKNPEFLRKFISKGGRMLPTRLTGACAKDQRKLRAAIKIARILALLPFVQV